MSVKGEKSKKESPSVDPPPDYNGIHDVEIFYKYYDKYSVRELDAWLAANKIPRTGVKHEKIVRIIKNKIPEWTVSELSSNAEKLGFAKNGSKEVLVERVISGINNKPSKEKKDSSTSDTEGYPSDKEKSSKRKVPDTGFSTDPFEKMKSNLGNQNFNSRKELDSVLIRNQQIIEDISSKFEKELNEAQSNEIKERSGEMVRDSSILNEIKRKYCGEQLLFGDKKKEIEQFLQIWFEKKMEELRKIEKRNLEVELKMLQMKKEEHENELRKIQMEIQSKLKELESWIY